VGEFGAGVGVTDWIGQCEIDIPVFAGLTHRLPAAQLQGVGRWQFFGLFKDAAGFGDIAESEIFFDGAGIDFALEAAVSE